MMGCQRHRGIQLDLLRYAAQQVDATVFKNEPGPCNQITNSFRYKSFTGSGYCRNSRRDMNCNTADLIALQVDLTGMNTAAHQNAERRDHLSDSRRALNCARRTVKHGEKAIATVLSSDPVKSPDLVPCRLVVSIE